MKRRQRREHKIQVKKFMKKKRKWNKEHPREAEMKRIMNSKHKKINKFWWWIFMHIPRGKLSNYVFNLAVKDKEIK